MNAEKPKMQDNNPDDPEFAARFSAAQTAMGDAADWQAEKLVSEQSLVGARLDGAVGAEVGYHDEHVEHAAMMADIKLREAKKLADPRSPIRKLADFVLRRNK